MKKRARYGARLRRSEDGRIRTRRHSDAWVAWWRSEAKKRAKKQNGRKGGLVKSRKKTIAVRRNA